MQKSANINVLPDARTEGSDRQSIAFFRAAAYEAKTLIEKTHAAISESRRLLAIAEKIGSPLIGPLE